jgi:hypothetical protein
MGGSSCEYGWCYYGDLGVGPLGIDHARGYPKKLTFLRANRFETFLRNLL